jgi:hypothetical protein
MSSISGGSIQRRGQKSMAFGKIPKSIESDPIDPRRVYDCAYDGNTRPPQCLSGACAVGFPLPEVDVRPTKEVECGQCELVCGMVTSVLPLPLPGIGFWTDFFGGMAFYGYTCKAICK